MKYCSQCGAAVSLKIPVDDNRPRHVCGACDVIHYQNPKIVAGCIPVWEDQVLLCKRAIEPRHGFWTLPAGFMEIGETTAEAAQRETLEEANARVELDGLYALINLSHVNQVYMIYRSRLLDLDFFPGIESLEVGLYKEKDIPWADLAFTTVRHTLQFYFEDRQRGNYPLRIGDIVKNDEGFGFINSP
ncbi:MAG: ADP-ribose pyrophosphatase YjhB (NUDIX family) [Parasphingorhabdus sp.]|jgi:ADP-ribose pyrophosphatase YjhB (NUDIX family)